jgi:sugar lactone lactonase YvrE
MWFFKIPESMAMTKDDSLFVTDSRNHRIVNLKTDGSVLNAFGRLGAANGQFNTPGSLAFSPNNTLYVADQGNHRIQQFKTDGSFIAAFGQKGSGDGHFQELKDMAFAPDGTLFVMDKDSNPPPGHSYMGSVSRVQHFKADGSFITLFKLGDFFVGPFGNETNLTKIVIAADGTLFILSHAVEIATMATKTHQIFHLKTDGTLINGFYYGCAGCWYDNGGITFAPDGSLFVANKSTIEHFQPDGHFIGALDGQFSSPGDVVMTSDGAILIADTDNNRIQKFAANIADYSYNKSTG